MTSTAVAKTEPKGITALIQAAAHRLTPMLPDDLTLDKLAQIVFFESQKTPGILECAPASIVSAVARALRSGLEIGETCYLVPFKGRCTFIADYKGLGQLMIAARAVRAVEMEAVREGDEFEFEMGLNAKLRHVPVWSKDRGRRAVTHAYVILRLPNGGATFKVMGAEEIDAIRLEHSKQWKTGPLTAWYACKTVLRQISKTMPKDKRLASFYSALEADEVEETIVEAEDVEHVEERPVHVDEDGVDLGSEDADLLEDQAIAAQDRDAEQASMPLGDPVKQPNRNAVRSGR